MVQNLIVGGGIGGVCVALELAKQGCSVTLVESSNSVLQKTSANTPGRLGLGFHYPNDFSLTTAKTCIQAAVIFHKEFSGVIRDTSECVRRGRYFILKNSFISSDVFLNYCDQIKNLYKTLVEPSEQHFFSDEKVDFYRKMDVVEYEHVVEKSQVQVGIETNERLVDWGKLDRNLRERLDFFKDKITVLTNHHVANIKTISSGYWVEVHHNNEIKILESKILINASCENRLRLDAQLFPEKSKLWSNRLKFLVNINLPKELLNTPSMFFSLGPGAMFTNNGDGTGYITYAPITNQGVRDALDELMPWKGYLDGKIPSITQDYVADLIIQGVSDLIPAMKKATLRRVLAGIVQSKGSADIYDPKSDIHKRNQSGVYHLAKDYYSFDTGKLVFAPMHAKKVVAMILNEDQGVASG